ncbi:MAG: alpha/beta hydrolase [Haloarculaceae archaeon]
MPYADHDGVSLAYERDGVPDGETVVLVEGLGYARWMWDWQREALVEEFDVLVFDNRGTGDSAVPEGPYTVPAMAGDLEAVLQAAEVGSAHVVGASLGGMIAQQYALDYDRAASVALLCTTPGGEEAVPVPEETLERMFEVPEEYDERAAIRYKMEPAFTPSFWADRQDLVGDIVDARLETDAPERARQWQGAAVEAFDVHDRLPEVDVPALVMHGKRDRVVPVANADLLAAGLPDVTVDRFDEGGSHLFFIERTEDVTDELVRFLH